MPAPLCVLAAVLAVSAAAPADAAAPEGPSVQAAHLDSGLRMAAARLDTPGAVAVEVRIAAGPRFEGRAEAGVAALAARLAWGDTAAWTAERRAAALAAAGWRWRTEVRADALVFRFVGPAEALDLLLALEADRLSGVAWSHGVHAAEVAALTAARRRSAPLERARATALRAALGLPREAAPLPSDVSTRAWWLRRVVPGATAVAVAGDVDPEAALAAVAEAFGAWRAPPPPPPPRVGGTTPPTADRREAPWVLAWPMPDPAEGPARMAAAHLAAHRLLGLGGTLRRALAGRADVTVQGGLEGRGAPVVLALVQPRPGVAPEAVRTSLEAATAAAAARGEVGGRTLEALAAHVRRALAVRLGEPGAAAAFLAAWSLRAGAPDAGLRFLEALDAVDAAAVADAATRWLGAPVVVQVQAAERRR